MAALQLSRPGRSLAPCGPAASHRQQPRNVQQRQPALQQLGQRAPPPPPARRRRSVAAAAAAEEEDLEVDGAFCMPAFVTTDNQRSKCFTVLDVEVGDYPGLLRVISWTLNGLDVVAQNAVVRTTPSGQAHNTFWLTTRSGAKLSDTAAELLAERVRDFVMYCSPDESAHTRTEFCAPPIYISNSSHPDYTVVMVQEAKATPGFLLEVASALSGMSIQILQGVVQGESCGEGELEPEFADKELEDIACHLSEDTRSMLSETSCLLTDLNEASSGRIFKFFVLNSQGHKLSYAGVSALIYTLSAVLGYRSHPTVPPEQELLLGAR